MIVPQRTIVFFGVFLILSIFHEKTDGVRLCGRRLADLLNFICEKHGGFHAPRAKRDVLDKSPNKSAYVEILNPVSRRSIADASGSSNDLTFNYQNGIVDECCKKPCTLATMVSYCANVISTENVNLEELIPAGIENLPSITDEDLAEYQGQQLQSAVVASNEDVNHPGNMANHIAYSSRPNLGLSPRNRPVFIVLSRLQEDDDQALGEYRF